MINKMFMSFRMHRKYLIAIMYASILFLDRLDLTMVNATLPTLSHFFNIPFTHTEWIANAFLLPLTLAISISAWVGDNLGTKIIFIGATLLFGLGYFLCSISSNIYLMISGRFISGIGGGLIIPVGMTIVAREFNRSEYASITSYIFMTTLIAPTIGPFIGGAIINFLSWRWVFLFAVPICMFIAIISSLVLKEYEHSTAIPFDGVGFFLAAFILTIGLFFLSEIGKVGITTNTLILSAIFSLLILIFGLYEKKHKYPLYELGFFKNPLFCQINLIQFFFQICHFGSMFTIFTYLQIGVGIPIIWCGLIIGIQGLGAICTSRLSVKLFNRFGPGLPIIIGLSGVGVLTPCILFINRPTETLLGVLIFFVRGLFSGMCGTPIQATSIIEFEKTELGKVNVLFNINRQISISVGIALSTIMIFYSRNITDVDLYSLSGGIGYKAFIGVFIMVPITAILGIIITTKIDNSNIVKLIHDDAMALKMHL